MDRAGTSGNSENRFKPPPVGLAGFLSAAKLGFDGFADEGGHLVISDQRLDARARFRRQTNDGLHSLNVLFERRSSHVPALTDIGNLCQTRLLSDIAY